MAERRHEISGWLGGCTHGDGEQSLGQVLEFKPQGGGIYQMTALFSEMGEAGISGTVELHWREACYAGAVFLPLSLGDGDWRITFICHLRSEPGNS